jgi:tRNA-specific adenosine deaminase 2
MEPEPLSKRPAASPDDAAFMEAAFACAREALDAGEVPVGCVFVLDGAVVARGRNRTNETRNATRHAELEAIDALLLAAAPDRRAGLLRGATLYVTVEPCIMCAGALRHLGIARAVFGCRNDRFGGCGTVENIHEVRVCVVCVSCVPCVSCVAPPNSPAHSAL